MLIGGVAAFLDPNPITLYPSGSRTQVSVEIAGVHKKIVGIVTIAVGAGIVAAGFCTKKISISEHPESQK